MANEKATNEKAINEKATINEKRSEIRKERFEFKLTMNGYIVCQRYFRINNFKKEAYGSLEIVQALDNCVEMIKKDMKDKTQMFLEYTAPQILKDEEEMNAWLQKPYVLNRPDYILLESTGDVYQIKDGELVQWTKPFNRNDYFVDKENQQESVLKLSFMDNGNEVVSIAWDASVYPKFIRSNVDISNSRNRYRNDGVFAPLEVAMIDIFNEKFEDLIPKIVNELHDTCSYEKAEDYTRKLTYGDKTYPLDIQAANRKFMKKLETEYWKKQNAKKKE